MGIRTREERAPEIHESNGISMRGADPEGGLSSRAILLIYGKRPLFGTPISKK